MTDIRLPVFFNNDRTLVIQKDFFFQESFGIQRKSGTGSCLLAQIGFILEGLSKGELSARDLAKHVFVNIKRNIGINGVTLDEISRLLSLPIRTKKTSFCVNASFDRIQVFNEMLVKVASGTPCLVFVPYESMQQMENEAKTFFDGCVDVSFIHPNESNRWHCYLAVGIDTSGYVILRDTRSYYAFNGFLKVSTVILEKGWKNIGAVSMKASVTKL